MSPTHDDFYSSGLNATIGPEIVYVNTGGLVREYLPIDSDRILDTNRAYWVNGLARLNLSLPPATNGNCIVLYAASQAGFKLTSSDRIQHEFNMTSVNGHIDSMTRGAHVMVERSITSWIMTVFAGYIEVF